MHAGVAGYFEQLWPTLRAAVLAEVVASRKPTEVFVTGHSLGGAVGTLVSYAVQQLLDSRMGRAAPTVSAVLFAR